jgi:hypothetical protein
MDAQRHWENIYVKKAADAVSWYRPHLETSLISRSETTRDPSLAARWATPFRRISAVLLNAVGTVKMFLAG